MTDPIAKAVTTVGLAMCAVIFIALMLTGCAKRESNYWGAVSRGVANELEK